MSKNNSYIKMMRKSWQKWSIAIRILPLLLLIATMKYLFHIYGLEIMELNALFTSVVAGTIFLIGFLISGVLSDYKESEKIPSELSACIKTLFDDAYTIYRSKNSDTAYQFMEFQKSYVGFLVDWIYKRERTKTMLARISSMNEFFVKFDQEGVQPGYIIKMKNDQNNLRKMILRIDTIRDTDFIGSAYAIVEVMAFLLGIGLLVMKIEPFYASLFFTLIVTFLISYMILLIHDIDNPFDYSAKGESGTEVSLKPIHDLEMEFQNFSLAND